MKTGRSADLQKIINDRDKITIIFNKHEKFYQNHKRMFIYALSLLILSDAYIDNQSIIHSVQRFQASM